MMRGQDYDLVGTFLFGGRRRRAYRELVLRRGVRPGDRVLDVGCGTRYLTALLAEEVGPAGAAVGVDPSEAMVAQASEVRSGTGARFVVGFAESLALEGGAFDVVTSSLALHHIDGDQRRAAAAEMARLLRPGGRSNPVDETARLLAGAGLTGTVLW